MEWRSESQLSTRLLALVVECLRSEFSPPCSRKWWARDFALPRLQLSGTSEGSPQTRYKETPKRKPADRNQFWQQWPQAWLFPRAGVLAVFFWETHNLGGRVSRQAWLALTHTQKRAHCFFPLAAWVNQSTGSSLRPVVSGARVSLHYFPTVDMLSLALFNWKRGAARCWLSKLFPSLN